MVALGAVGRRAERISCLVCLCLFLCRCCVVLFCLWWPLSHWRVEISTEAIDRLLERVVDGVRLERANPSREGVAFFGLHVSDDLR